MSKRLNKGKKKMLPTAENKVRQTITLDPVVAAWVTQKAAMVAIDSQGQEKSNDSKFINDILRAEMEKEAAADNGKRLERFTRTKLLKKAGIR